ncbi:exodeoxyribonuclease VII large subunit [Candidatus Uhrbacteria bacterium]|nr:exodeoxyribonuclease VII large subunit [Candidatus Uhrbacteria bacterium]
MEFRCIAVSEFVDVINATLKETWPSDVAVEGEVSGFRVSQGQWVSFDLKDDKALINVFMTVWNLRVPIEDGMKVKVFGSPRVYPKYGKFSLSADRVEISGEGNLRRALALLRERLEKEGLFDPSRKRTLPRFPKKIALIASRESAAYGDFLRIVTERWRGLEIDSYHVVVQGERAPMSVMNALEAAQNGEYDAIIITRGGGSFEDLIAFNDEVLVRAIHASRIPTMVAIGHERDITLAEEVADIRGSTPTDCARRLVPDRKDILYEIVTMQQVVDDSMRELLDSGHRILEKVLFAPGIWLQARSVELSHLSEYLQSYSSRWLQVLRERLEMRIQILSGLDPRQVLARGYVLVKGKNGRMITHKSLLKDGDGIRVIFQDGEIDACVGNTSSVQGNFL